jgi:hypothetical protein
MYIGLFVWSLAFSSVAEQTYLTNETFEQDKAANKAVVFLSQVCPCSNSHVEHLNKLISEHPEVSFYGVISEPVTNKNKKAIEAYFNKDRFSFPLIRDDKQVLVKKYGALKTPHVTFFRGGKISYQGGVTNKKSFKESSVKFLETNLNLLANNKKFKYSRGSSLGCYIRRY